MVAGSLKGQASPADRPGVELPRFPYYSSCFMEGRAEGVREYSANMRLGNCVSANYCGMDGEGYKEAVYE